MKENVGDTLMRWAEARRYTHCGRCRFFCLKTPVLENEAPHGDCRRHAVNAVNEHGNARWPVVAFRAWCGEWQLQTAEVAPPDTERE